MFDSQNYGQFAPQMQQGAFWRPAPPSYPPPSAPRPQSGPAWIFVPQIKDASAVSVPPGQTAWIMAQNEAAFAVRAADPTGVTTTKFYRFEEFDATAPAAPAEDYVTRKEFEEFVSRLTAQKGKKVSDE